MNDRIALLAALRQDLITFLDELSNVLPHDPNLVMMKSFARVVIMADVADYISKNIAPLEDKVKARDETYFIENAVFFEQLQNRESTVNYFRDLWIKSDDQDAKHAVWQWLEHFIQMSKRYQALVHQG